MYKHQVIVNITILLFCTVLGLGCESKTKEITKPKIVSKKISEEHNQLSEKEKISSNITISAERALDSNQTQITKIDDVSDKITIQKANYESVSKISNNEDVISSTLKTGLPEDLAEDNKFNKQDSVLKTKDEEEKRKAAELLASIHSEVNKTAQNNNDGLDRLGNPFLPLFSDAPIAPKSKAKRKSRPEKERTPLEKVDLSQLKLVATLRAESGNKALVEDSTGKGYVVNKGTYIGINSGSVVEITNISVVVEEEIETLAGDVKIKRREIKLQKAPGE